MAIWDKVQIISLAVGLLGKGPITSIEQGGDLTKSASAWFDVLFPNEISQYNWRFATAIQQLAQIVPIPLINEWKYIYELPANYLALWKFHPIGTDFQIYENKNLYTNAATVKIEYRFLPDISRLPAYFVTYFATRLASIMALSGAQNKTYTKTTGDMADRLLIQALATDAQSHPNEAPLRNPFVQVRN